MSERTAYHEAGHAFVAHYLGGRVRSVTLEPDWDDGPLRHADVQVEWFRDRFSEREFAERAVLVALAGPVAEMIHGGEPFHPGFVAEWAADWQLAWEAAAPLVASDRKRLAFLEQATRQLYRMLDQDAPWAAIAALVDELLAHETLDAEMVEASLANWPI